MDPQMAQWMGWLTDACAYAQRFDNPQHIEAFFHGFLYRRVNDYQLKVSTDDGFNINVDISLQVFPGENFVYYPMWLRTSAGDHMK